MFIVRAKAGVPERSDRQESEGGKKTQRNTHGLSGLLISDDNSKLYTGCIRSHLNISENSKCRKKRMSFSIG